MGLFLLASCRWGGEFLHRHGAQELFFLPASPEAERAGLPTDRRSARRSANRSSTGTSPAGSSLKWSAKGSAGTRLPSGEARTGSFPRNSVLDWPEPPFLNLTTTRAYRLPLSLELPAAAEHTSSSITDDRLSRSNAVAWCIKPCLQSPFAGHRSSLALPACCNGSSPDIEAAGERIDQPIVRSAVSLGGSPPATRPCRALPHQFSRRTHGHRTPRRVLALSNCKTLDTRMLPDDASIGRDDFPDVSTSPRHARMNSSCLPEVTKQIS